MTIHSTGTIAILRLPAQDDKQAPDDKLIGAGGPSRDLPCDSAALVPVRRLDSRSILFAALAIHASASSIPMSLAPTAAAIVVGGAIGAHLKHQILPREPACRSNTFASGRASASH